MCKQNIVGMAHLIYCWKVMNTIIVQSVIRSYIHDILAIQPWKIKREKNCWQHFGVVHKFILFSVYFIEFFAYSLFGNGSFIWKYGTWHEFRSKRRERILGQGPITIGGNRWQIGGNTWVLFTYLFPGFYPLPRL